jgi:uncharacterized small protein (DUF1192 family)
MEDDERPGPAAWVMGSDISTLSVEDLREMADALRAEAERLDGAANAKRDELSAADALFRK